MSDYVKRYEDWPKKKFCKVVRNADGEYDVVGAESGTVENRFQEGYVRDLVEVQGVF